MNQAHPIHEAARKIDARYPNFRIHTNQDPEQAARIDPDHYLLAHCIYDLIRAIRSNTEAIQVLQRNRP